MINKQNPPILTKLEVEIDGAKRLVLANNNRLFNWDELNDIEAFVKQTKDAYMEFNINNNYIEKTNDEWLEQQRGILLKIASRPREKHQKKGFVYLCKSLKNGWYKIGVTNNVKNRMEQISARCGDIELIGYHPSENCLVIEREMHIKFKDKLQFGEWFSLNKEDVDEFITWFECPIK